MVVVTGATGLLGSIIVDHFVSRKIPVTALYRNSRINNNNDIKWINADVMDIQALIKCFEGATGVVHAAALVSFAKHNKENMFTVNAEGTANVVNACLQTGVKRLVHISSVAALGKPLNQKWIDEKTTWTGNEGASNYAQSKYLAELEIFRGEAEGLSVASINPSIILAAGNSHRSSGKIFEYIFNEHPFYTDGQLNYVDARDVAEMVLRLYENPSLKGRYIASAGTIAWKELFHKIADRFHKKPPGIKISETLAKLAAGAEWVRSSVTGKEPLITRETAQIARQRITYVNKKASAELAMSFRELDNTLDWCCEAYLANNSESLR
jgi:nucleoside-diphosphate-sugar epimerase